VGTIAYLDIQELNWRSNNASFLIGERDPGNVNANLSLSIPLTFKKQTGETDPQAYKHHETLDTSFICLIRPMLSDNGSTETINTEYDIVIT